jgi:hypothetical protein
MSKTLSINNKIVKIENIQYDKYKAIALDYIKNGFNDIRGIYHKYYPDANENSVDTEASRLLDNVKFKAIQAEVWRELRLEDYDIAKETAKVLWSIMFKETAKDSDKIQAAKVLRDNGDITNINVNVSKEDEADYKFIRSRLGSEIAC